MWRKCTSIRAIYEVSSDFLTSPSLAAMCEVVAIAISAVGRRSPKPFGYRIPRVAEISDGSESVSVEQQNKLARVSLVLTVLAPRLHVLTIGPDY